MAAAGVVLVTGASRGLGATIARTLAADGWTVAVNYRNGAGAAREVADGIRAAGGTAAVFEADVTDEASVAALVAAVTEQLGPVTALVANATGPQPEVAVEDLTWDDHLGQLLFFVKSPTLLVRAALPAMRAAGRGRVVLVGSDMTDRALPGWSAYVAAKAAQIGLARTWARELGPHGVTVNVVAPGWVPVERHADVPASAVQAYAAEVPLRRIGRPDDVAGAVRWLLSDEAAFVTGERVTVNGGHTI
ncbi:SDR family oxidoreductase [Dactylosporangium sp. NPDC005555]|uniref:SDR family NAD(P)-dependent oxidoreductase n=1 Tax=Dactylosporangium sp. NPDC005555 TaxID=3154889 RepID=UPI0033A03927